MVVGRCNSTAIWMNQPPVGMSFAFPQGIPGFVDPDQSQVFTVQVAGIGATVPQPNTGQLYVSVDDQPFVNSAMTQISPNLYEATLPATPCASQIRFYVTAQSTGAQTFSNPSNAPDGFYAAASALGMIETVHESYEADVSGWTVINDPSLTSGAWQAVDPNGSLHGVQIATPSDDAEAGVAFVQAFVTQNEPVNGGSNANDVDGGPTRLVSPPIDLEGTDGFITYARWAYTGSGTPDALEVAVSNDDGQNWTVVESITSTGSQWQNFTFQVSDFVTPTATVRVRFSVADGDNSTSEAGVDAFIVQKLDCGGDECTCTSDVNGDQYRDGADVSAFVACLLEGGNCTCADANSNGSVEDTDIPAFVDAILTGNACP
jgi:hypothetical protein